MHNLDVIARQISLAPGFKAVVAMGDSFAEATPDLIDQVLNSVSAFADASTDDFNQLQ